jgi:hypothetical protein
MGPVTAMQRTATQLAGIALLLAGILFSLPASAQAIPPSCPSSLATTDLIDHDFSVSFCELCEIGTVRIEIENPFRDNDDADFSDIVVTENLLASGLTYVPGSTSFDTDNVPTPPVVEPAVSGTNGSVLTWTLSNQFVMDTRSNGAGSGSIRRLRIEFNVRRHASVGEEGLVGANRNIDAQVEFTPSCDTGYRHTASTGLGELPLLEPVPVVTKLGRNLDAGQGRTQYSDPVYGHETDDVIWQIRVQNTGTADLQDFTFDDVMDPGNYVINYVCDSQADAESAGSGGGPGGCASFPGVTTLNNVSVADLFGGATPYIAAPAGGQNFYYIVGRVTDSCTDRTNTVSDIQWGCEVQPPPGGILATSSGLVPAGDSAALNTLSNTNLQVDMFLEGTNRSQPMGTKGTVSIRLRNRTGGTIYGDASGIILDNIVLPPEYVVDPTFDPVISLAPAYGTVYPGMVDTVTWTNPQPGTYPNLTSNDPADPLANTSPEFSITSSSENPDTPNANMIRHGDDVIVRFRVVLIDPLYYDRNAYIDIRNERPGSDPPNTDPPESFPVDSRVDVTFREFCSNNEHTVTGTGNDTAEPEDIDLDVSNGNLEFILTNTDSTRLVAQLINRGGHDARDYFAYVTFGDAMQVSNSPSACSEVANPPPMREWQIPVPIPASATVYRCNVEPIRPGQRRSFNFDVVKNPNASAEDDLTFRIDVTGEVTLSDGTPLWFPTPQNRGDGILRHPAARERLLGRYAARACRRLQPDEGAGRHLLRE